MYKVTQMYKELPKAGKILPEEYWLVESVTSAVLSKLGWLLRIKCRLQTISKEHS